VLVQVIYILGQANSRIAIGPVTGSQFPRPIRYSSELRQTHRTRYDAFSLPSWGTNWWNTRHR